MKKYMTAQQVNNLLQSTPTAKSELTRIDPLYDARKGKLDGLAVSFDEHGNYAIYSYKTRPGKDMARLVAPGTTLMAKDFSEVQRIATETAAHVARTRATGDEREDLILTLILDRGFEHELRKDNSGHVFMARQEFVNPHSDDFAAKGLLGSVNPTGGDVRAAVAAMAEQVWASEAPERYYYMNREHVATQIMDRMGMPNYLRPLPASN